MYFVQLNHIYPSIFIYDLSQQRITFLPTYLLLICIFIVRYLQLILTRCLNLLSCSSAINPCCITFSLTLTYKLPVLAWNSLLIAHYLLLRLFLDHNNFVVDHELIFNIFNLCSFYTYTGFGLFLVYYSTIINSKWLVLQH